jgi:hypothetical protein
MSDETSYLPREADAGEEEEAEHTSED